MRERERRPGARTRWILVFALDEKAQWGATLVRAQPPGARRMIDASALPQDVRDEAARFSAQAARLMSFSGDDEQYIDANLTASYGRMPRERSPLRERGRLRVPGWQIGWINELGADAAVTNVTREVLVVATDAETGNAPISLDEPVSVGLYRLRSGEYEEVGRRIEFDTFDEAVKLGAKELERRLAPR